MPTKAQRGGGVTRESNDHRTAWCTGLDVRVIHLKIHH